MSTPDTSALAAAGPITQPSRGKCQPWNPSPSGTGSHQSCGKKTQWKQKAQGNRLSL